MSRYYVLYPSGRSFTVRGVLALVALPGEPAPYPTVDDGEYVFVLDPRAVIRLRGRLVYAGRDLAPTEQYTPQDN